MTKIALSRRKALATIQARVSVASGGCWEWKLATGNGYGRVRLDGSIYLSHRLAAYAAGRLTSASWVADPRVIHHTCDNRLCCNPAHLQATTHAANAMDAAQKGRTTKRKFTDAQAADIRRARASGVPADTLAQLYSVDYKTIVQIVEGKTYRERGTGVEPATSCLGSRRSTAELAPHKALLARRGGRVNAEGRA